jgi:hypothetical protein
LDVNCARIVPTALALGAALVWSVSTQATEPALNAFGQAGGLVIPYGFALPPGMVEGQFNDYIDPRYGKTATGAQTYWGAIGLFPYVEVSGGLANYPGDVPAPYSGADHFVLRHLMGDVKLEIPQFFPYQPAIAFGITDVGGQTHYFRSTYGVVSQAVGPFNLTAGYGGGDRLDGVFGGVQLSVWHTGLSLLAEDDGRTPYIGARYQSPRIRWLADANVIATVTRAVKTTDGVSPRTSISVGVQIPLGRRFDASRCAGDLCNEQGGPLQPGDAVVAPQEQPIARALPPLPARAAVPSVVVSAPAAGAHSAASPEGQDLAFDRSALVNMQSQPATNAVDSQDGAELDVIAAQLFAAGLERVRVGVSGSDLIVEYENHRYNQNEADALGIVLGVASEHAPAGVERVRAVIKKVNQPLAEVSVSRAAYAQFVEGGSSAPVSASMAMRTDVSYDAQTIAWHGDEHRHGLTRIQIEPVTSYLYGTEYGNFDISLGANIQGYVPLWHGAELYTSYIAPVYNTKNMDDGRVFSQYRLRGGLSSAALAQSFWVMPEVLNVASVGKFDYQYLGIENETTAFVPGRPDLVRLRLAWLQHEPDHDDSGHEANAVLTYRWVEPSWNMWIEAGAARYVGGDKGPLITLTRWFDDVAVSIHAEHSGRGTFAGATISFPLTPRQGMQPGITQLYGSEQFAMDFRTRVGSTNYLDDYAAQNLDYAYGTQKNLLNQGRFSAGYFATQLYRMRDAYARYAQPEAARAKAVGRGAPVVSAAAGKESFDPCKNSPEIMKKVQAQLPAVCQSLLSGEIP